ncbi:hypothetical protein ACFQY7_17805 [Actinomadura luteofluorescens]|uniref:Uncharacterized protein n=1 Tax=Actinomadura luteofluorescens TaxID=46163 RepID=A0A7Y9JK01_9ACTN|nr:hypothetical protein [Actinomadura luteofluorescens]NYD51760.1 hypothetical protein [Actinomadura luteofluorescens]
MTGKPNGKIVGDYCTTVRNAAENITFIAVKTDSAANGIGWMNTKVLTPTTQTG